MGIRRSDIPATVEGGSDGLREERYGRVFCSRKHSADSSGDERVVASSLRERKEPTLQVR